eukprot:TRINITY_DN7201_c0_g1_i1.p1 TRINITY_DN7201_c0_g1~~TRINITY_DN7201_c0_g1_i1.p1  ORF type:complete len:177 (-),score=43.18 TRINITY_DN7201_c0_g1_i1:80-610(-)
MESDLKLSDDLVEKFMNGAFLEAEKALEAREVPIGCVIVHVPSDKEPYIVGRGHNLTNEMGNPTLHAEFVATDEVLETFPSTIFEECVLFVTCEPCIMCAAAISELNIKAAYFGCKNDRFGGCGSVFDAHDHSYMPNGKSFRCFEGVQAERAVEILKRFYARGNPAAPEQKRKREK